MTGLGSSYRRLWAASGLSNLADGVFQVALPLLAVRLTDSPALVAGVALAQRLPWLVLALPAGALADRLDRRRAMLAVQVLRAAVLGLLAAVVAADLDTLPLLYAVALVLGAGETLFDTAAQSIMPAVVDRDRLSDANGKLYAVELTMNQFIGPPLGGVLVGLSIALAFAGSAAAYLVAALALTLVVGSFRPERAATPTTLRADIAEGLRFLWRNRVLRALGLMTGGFNLASSALGGVFVLYAVDPGPMGLSEAGFGLLLTSGAVGSLLASPVTAPIERAMGRQRTFALSMVLGVVFLGMPAITASVPANAVGGLAGGASAVLWNIIAVSLRQRIAPDRLLGRVNAGYRLLAWGTMPIGAALGGALAEIFGLRVTFAVSAAVVVLTMVGLRVVTDDAIAAAETGGEAGNDRAATVNP